MLTALALLTLQTCTANDPLPERIHQPRVFDPGLDGGVQGLFDRGEFTPDGRLLIAFRKVFDAVHPSASRYALTASLTRSDNLVPSATGHLDAFYDYDETFVPPSNPNNPYGTDFTFGAYDTSNTEWAVIHYGHALVACSEPVCEPGEPCPPCIPACPTGNMTTDMRLDPYYPLSNKFGSSHMTVAMRPLTTPNPFPSNAQGAYKTFGNYTTYELWVVRNHSRGLAGSHECKPSLGGPLIQLPTSAPFADAILVGQNVRVVVDQATNTIVSTHVDEYEELQVAATQAPIEGIEPSITSDGRLILFHGDGTDPNANPGEAVVTYVFNPDGCSATGWTPPRPITTPPTAAELGSMTPEQFLQSYKLFAQPIKMPLSATGSPQTKTYSPGEDIPGTYPWVSKDGSYYNAYSVRSGDAVETGVFSTKIKSGAYVCGDLTNWTIKRIDDPSLNPSRRGGPWAWPRYKSPTQGNPNSWGAITMSTGVRPGVWEPLLAHGGALFPTTPADRRVPVLPLFLPILDTYGEVRFEEADGNYLLYMACNESFALDPNALSDGMSGEPFLNDPTSTPDSSGTRNDVLCKLNAGAAFPQEVYWNDDLTLPYQVASANLRKDIGASAWGALDPFHENVGFKGQGIVVNGDGAVVVSGAPKIGQLDAFTVQFFVKCVGPDPVPSGSTTTLFEYGLDVSGTPFSLFQVNVGSSGAVNAHLYVDDGSNPLNLLSASSRPGALIAGNPLAEPSQGWLHVTVSFASNDDTGESRLELYVDGLLDGCATHPAPSSVFDYPLPTYYVAGPGRQANPAPVNNGNALLVLDEIAVSDVCRTQQEIRREAYVAQEETVTGVWPSSVPLPAGLEADESKWPLANPHDPAVEALGAMLFADTGLSASGTRSCETCHVPSKGFADNTDLPLDVNGQELKPFNAPTLWNSAFGTPKTFTGKAATLEEQVLLPLTTQLEMGHADIAPVLAYIDSVPSYQTQFVNLFGSVNEDALSKALATYVRTLTTGGSPFDNDNLNAAAERGKHLFFGKARCASCHRGSNFSDDSFHNIRTVLNDAVPSVQGHGLVSARQQEDGHLKTPTLRGLEKTSPYFHDGRNEQLPHFTLQLKKVVEHYNDPFTEPDANVKGRWDRDLRRLELTGREIDDLVAFLESLSE